MKDRGISRHHDPPQAHHLDADGRDTREHHEVKPLPGDHPDRLWQPKHLAAGYHLQPWDWEELGDDHEVCGDYRCGDWDTLTVRFLEIGWTGGPELELDWASGPTLTVLDADVARQYLSMHNAERASS